ncbi:hypothetical protein M408DRAFT_6262 [Serendipita vermifera MAFF 305830]|uniref:Uncharacterized protein n=1 Tax=Serendipita vermifera MAFF 305830 TaxID=933852 RepID=A0A0C2XVC5_SERVB|nr:hypothetical protein M408DRAFT_6262 [Serendipita vermifera MAFF 305830]
MSKPQKPPSRPASVTSSTRTGKSSANPRFFRPVPYSTTLALQQLMDGGSDASYATKPTPVKRASGSSSRPRHADPSPASTGRDQIASEIGRGRNLPVVDEQGQVWLDWEERQEYVSLMEGRPDNIVSDWVGFPSPTADGGRDSSDEESTSRRLFDRPSRQLLEAFSFGNESSAAPRNQHHEDMVPPDQPVAPRPRGNQRIRRVRTSESLRAGSAPLVIPPVPSQHHPIRPDEDAAAQEFLQSSFDPPLFTPTQEELERLKNSGRRGSIFKSIAKKLGRK